MRIAHGRKSLPPTGTVVPTPPSAPTLGNLTVANPTFLKGTARNEPILGATAGSTISFSGLPAGFTVDNVNRLLVFDGTTAGQAVSVTPSESLTGATNTPHSSPAVGLTINAAPAFNANPSISGTPAVGSTLTGNDGTITGYPVPTVSARRFKSAGVLVGSSTTYTLTLSDQGNMIAYEVDASNAFGTTTGRSVAVGPVTGTGLATPAVTNVSATGTAPVILSLTDGDYVAGLYLQWEFAGSLTPAKNGDGSYTTPTQGGVAFIDGNSWARLDLALGYNDPSGAFAFHCRVLRDDPSGSTTVTDQLGNTSTYDASGWSTDYADTIGGSVAVWASSGINRSQYITADSTLQLHVNNILGAACGNRATIPASGKKHFELSIDELRAGGVSDIIAGITDASTDLSLTNHPLPGNSLNPGCCCKINGTTNSVIVYCNGAAQGTTTLPAAAAVGDKFVVEFDTTANTVQFYWFRAADSSVTLLRSFTMTSDIPAAYYAYGGGFYGTTSGATDSDKFTANFGATAFSVTPTAGYTFYG